MIYHRLRDKYDKAILKAKQTVDDSVQREAATGRLTYLLTYLLHGAESFLRS